MPAAPGGQRSYPTTHDAPITLAAAPAPPTPTPQPSTHPRTRTPPLGLPVPGSWLKKLDLQKRLLVDKAPQLRPPPDVMAAVYVYATWINTGGRCLARWEGGRWGVGELVGRLAWLDRPHRVYRSLPVLRI